MSDSRVEPATPRGFRDILPAEAAERRAIVEAMLGTASSWGYGRVETPALERAETLAAGAGAAVEGDAFRLFDLDGGLLALRPEMTVPIARLVASRMRDEPGPYRLSYVADVYREHASYRGQYRQFTQVGAELVAAGGPAADAECVALAVEMLEDAGLAEFVVAVGTVGVLTGLLEASGRPAEWKSAVMTAVHERNLVELDGLADEADLEEPVRSALREVPRLRGGLDALESCRELAAPCGCPEVVDGLIATWYMLEAAGVSGRVSVDFGIVRAFDYYTGLVLEASVPGMGLPLGGGGRYDGLLARFGRDLPAAGFALALERVHIAMAEQGVAPAAPPVPGTIADADAARAFERAREARLRGERTVIDLDAGSDAEAGRRSR
jgi:ATP phosphoribosyltransferase regulatory subunit